MSDLNTDSVWSMHSFYTRVRWAAQVEQISINIFLLCNESEQYVN